MKMYSIYACLSKYIKIIVLCAISVHVSAEQLSGKVVRVIDGDTIDIEIATDPPVSSSSVRVRLMNIDAPEITQPYGEWSKSQLENLIDGEKVSVNYSSHDKYGRILGLVYTSRNMQVNTWMVCNGAAWVYSKYSNDPVLELVEKEAKINKVGLWNDSNPVPPWEWRRR